MKLFFRKKIIFMTFALCAGLLFSACVNEVDDDNIVGSGYQFPQAGGISKAFDSRLYGNDGKAFNTVKTYNLEGWEDIPFLYLEDAAKLLAYINFRGYNYGPVEESEGLYYYKYYQTEAGSVYPAEIKDDTLYFDVKNQTIYSDNFTRIITNTNTLANGIGCLYYSEVADASSACPKIQFDKTKTCYAKEKEKTSINLAAYGLKMFLLDGREYGLPEKSLFIPFQVLADTCFRYTVCSFNSQDYYLYFTPNDKSNAVFWGYNYGREYSAARSRLKAEYNYRNLCLLFDLNYCLKDQRSKIGKDNIGAYINDSIFKAGLGFDLVSTDTSVYDRALVKFLVNYIDDGHTGYYEPSLYQNYSSFSQFYTFAKSVQGPRDRSLDSIYKEMKLRRQTAGGSEGLFYISEGQENKMAIISFDGFKNNNPGSVTSLEELAALNTYAFFEKSFNEIKNYNSVKNVVIDLSCNDGGAVLQCMLALCYLEDPDKFYLAEKNHLDNSIAKFYCNIETKDGDPSIKQNYKFYVLTSGYSFSCGNFFPSVCKYQLNIPVVGQQSGGGGGIVKQTQSSDGAIFKTSASAEMCALDANGNYICIDAGVPVDYEISYDDFYSGECRYANLYRRLKEKYPGNFN